MTKTSLNAHDIQWLAARGISVQSVEEQIRRFQRGTQPVELVRPATLHDGIIPLSAERTRELSKFFDHAGAGKKILKFVPASGASSRMFQVLLAALYDGRDLSPVVMKEKAAENHTEYQFLHQFFTGLSGHKFVFHEALAEKMRRCGFSLSNAIQQADFRRILRFLLLPEGLGYGQMPKGLIPFHFTGPSCRTAAEEHLVEAIALLGEFGHDISVHFTVAQEFLESFSKFMHSAAALYEKKGTNFDLSFSIQKPSTDTISVDLEDRLFRDDKNLLVLRPGGHGALIENLNELDADVIFIKNIDNITQDYLFPETISYKKMLGGLLLQIQQRVFGFLNRLGPIPEPRMETNEITAFLQRECGLELPADFRDWPFSRQHSFLRRQLNRPLRVCGMVKNEGEPGGGPFWVKTNNGLTTLQIVEKAQINIRDPRQKKILDESTHFNPVDLVCATQDFQEQPFDLSQFIDHNAYFITEKSSQGKPLKAMELPGLWNGAMADWITIFAEVPLQTFSPVKTVNDLLKPEHQPVEI